MEDCLLILDTDCQLSRVFPTRIQKVWESLNFMTYLCLSSKQRHCDFRGIHHEFKKWLIISLVWHNSSFISSLPFNVWACFYLSLPKCGIVSLLWHILSSLYVTAFMSHPSRIQKVRDSLFCLTLFLNVIHLFYVGPTFGRPTTDFTLHDIRSVGL